MKSSRKKEINMSLLTLCKVNYFLLQYLLLHLKSGKNIFFSLWMAPFRFLIDDHWLQSKGSTPGKHMGGNRCQDRFSIRLLFELKAYELLTNTDSAWQLNHSAPHLPSFTKSLRACEIYKVNTEV